MGDEMRPEEAFSVVVRSVGLIILVLGLGMVVTDAVENWSFPSHMVSIMYAWRGGIEGSFFVVLGIVLLFKTKWIVRLVYHRET